ncbi:MAG: T9SS type A sorting domain-containing protein [Cytophagaceae bacterium]|jgi:parallel beta-helix repeat protein|nr:T9SS type A sorting domain-containing protein [Cytophagaceae bacterium]
MKRLMLFSLMCVWYTSFSETYYVTPDGNRPSGMSYPQGTYLRPQEAADRVNPGDLVYFMNGTYYGGDPLLLIYRPGTASKPIVFKNYPGHEPTLKANSWGTWNIIKLISQVRNGQLYTPAYIEINGLRIAGNRSSVNDLPHCENNSAFYNGTGIGVYGPFSWDGNDQPYNWLSNSEKTLANARRYIPHHITIRNCRVYDCTSSGIAMQRADFFTIEGNTVYDNCHYTINGTSGINVYEPIPYSSNASLYSTGYQNYVSKNKAYRNKLIAGDNCIAAYDGNGIILDDFRHEQNNDGMNPSFKILYPGKTLVDNNIAYHNGGSGLHVYLGTNTDVIHNTFYSNITINPRNGELYVVASFGVRCYNNICHASGPTKNLIQALDNLDTEFSHNMYWPEDAIIIQNEPMDIMNNGFMADPMFSNPSASGSAVFSLKPGSAAINAAMATSLTKDFQNAARSQQGGPDMGALESPYTTTSLQLGNSSSSHFTPFPNPIQSGRLHFGNEAQRVSLYSATGAHILQTEQVNSIELPELPSGIYLLQLDGFTFTLSVQ